MKIERLGAGVFTIEGFLSLAECEKLISESEETGFELATINAISGPEINKEIRNNERLILDDSELAHHLFHRAEPYLPKEIDEW